jgi:Tfp pilus assembly protein PilF
MNKANVRLLVWHFLVWATLFPGSAVSPCAATSPRDAAARCQALLEQGNLPAARQTITDALEQFPNDPNLHNLLGVIEARDNSFAPAEKAFRQAVELAPGFLGAYLNLGRLYQEHPEQPDAVDRAVAVYQRLLREQPEHAEANYQAAVLLQAKKAYRNSITHLDRLPVEAQQRSHILSLRCAAQAALGEKQSAGETARRLAEHGDLQDLDVAPILPSLYENDADEIALLLLEALDRRKLASPASREHWG